VPTLLGVVFVLILVLGASANAARGDTTLSSQVTLANVDPKGQGTGTFNVFYNLPQQVQVGTNVTVPIKLYVDNLTVLMSFLQDYNVSVSLSLSNGNQISGQVGVTAAEAATNLGALQLHAGQTWGPVNITLPLTPANTGLSPGQEVLANATLNLHTDVWFVQPVNGSRPESSQSHVGYAIITDGVPPGSQPNYVGLGLLAVGVIFVLGAVATRPKKTSLPGGGATKKAPGSV